MRGGREEGRKEVGLGCEGHCSYRSGGPFPIPGKLKLKLELNIFAL